MDEDKDKGLIAMFLDIEHLYGQHEGRLAPVLWVIGLTALPILIVLRYGLYWYIPWPIILIVVLMVFIKSMLVFPGRESERKKEYRASLHNTYTQLEDMLTLTTVHEDGCIEYKNGVIAYAVVCFNGSTPDEIKHSVATTGFMSAMLDGYQFDIGIYNLVDMPYLYEYYDKVVNFKMGDAAKSFVDVIDHSIELVESKSLVQATVFLIYATRSDWKKLRYQIDQTVSSDVSSDYKQVYVLDSIDAINEVLDLDCDTNIDLQKLQRQKYATNTFGSARVLAYDLDESLQTAYNVANAEDVIEQNNSLDFLKK